jgi:hypothetical protein
LNVDWILVFQFLYTLIGIYCGYYGSLRTSYKHYCNAEAGLSLDIY